MKKKLLALVLAVVMTVSCTTAAWMITNAAGGSGAYSVANTVNKLASVTGTETLHSEKLSNFTAAFDYTPTDDNAELALRYDYDSTLKKTAVNEDFEGYEAGDKIGTVTVEDGGARGLIGSVGEWRDNTYTVFTGTDYDASFWAYQNNSDWGKMTIRVKSKVFFAFIGKEHGGKSNTIGLYAGTGDVNGNAATDTANNTLLASFDLNDYGYSYNKGQVYYRVTVTKDNVKMYISPVNDFDGLDPVIDVTLDEKYVGEESQLSFAQGNTGLKVDDIKVIDITKDGYETVTETVRTYEKYEEVFSEDYEDETASEAVKGTVAVIENDGSNMLDMGADEWNVRSTVAENLPENASIQFYIKANNPDWDNIHIYFNGDYKLQFTGSLLNNPNAYTVKLKKGDTVYASSNTIGNFAEGKYVKLDIQDGLVNLYINSTSDFSNATAYITYQLRDTETANKLYIHKEGNALCRIDNVAVYDYGGYTEETVKVHSGEYGQVDITNSKAAANEVNGEEKTEIKSADLGLNVGKTYRIAVLRDRTNITVTVDGKQKLKATVPYDDNNHYGEVVLSVSGAAVTNVDVYDSGRITFEDRGAVLTPYEVSDNITTVAKSSEKNKLEQLGNDLNVSVDSSQNNSATNSSAILTEDAGDLVLDFYIKDGRSDWIDDTIFIGVPGEITDEDGLGYQYDPWALYKQGYAVEFGAGSATSPYYKLLNVNNGATSSITKRTDDIEFHWGSSAGHVRIERKGETLRVYMAMLGDTLVLIDEVKADKHLLGNVYWYHRQSSASMMNIRAYDTANRTDYTAGAGASSEPTRLVAFYSTTKTDKDIPIEQSDSEYSKKGIWYSIDNPHRNATYLKQSLTGDVELTNMDMSFEYYGQGYWMTNEFYFASSNKYGTTSYKLAVKGDGTAGLSDEGYNLILSRSYYGKTERLAAAKVANLSNGVLKFHITINNGKIKVSCKTKNAPDSMATVLEGDSGGFDIRGGVYMYVYDDCNVLLKDIVIYNGVDTASAEQPDLSVEKQTLVENDFEDANNASVEQFTDEKSGKYVKVNTDSGMLQFNTNHNNYIQTLIEPTQDWLGDLTIEFDYLGHRGDWNLNFFGWHCSRKSGDRYSSIYLAVLGNNVASNPDAGDNIAGVKGANVQLVASEYGKKTCIGYASIPEINDGREHTFRITQEGGLIKVWAWVTSNDMPAEPVITATNYHADLCYGGLTIHSWCGNFSIDNLKILNYADYTIPESVSIYNREIGEIFRVDRVYEKVAVVEPEEEEVVELEPQKSNLGLILGITIPAAVILIAAATLFIIILIKRKKKNGEKPTSPPQA